LDLDYQPPGSSIDDGMGKYREWCIRGCGSPCNIPVFIPSAITVDDFVWTCPDFCENMGGGDYWVAGIPDPPPRTRMPEIVTQYFGLTDKLS
jgi:hypothetical protein